jgi:hypothetical protein
VEGSASRKGTSMYMKRNSEVHQDNFSEQNNLFLSKFVFGSGSGASTSATDFDQY